MTGDVFEQRIDGPTLEEVAAAAERLERWALVAGVRFELRRELLLVFDELATNVARHAAGASVLEISAQRRSPTGVVLVLEDDGPAYDPFSRPEPDTTLPLEQREPGGLGVHLVRRLAARVGYRRVDGRNRVEVELRPASGLRSAPGELD